MKDLLLRGDVVARTSKVKLSCRRLTDYVTKISATRAALSLSFVQPIKSLICGVVVANAVVIS